MLQTFESKRCPMSSRIALRHYFFVLVTICLMGSMSIAKSSAQFLTFLQFAGGSPSLSPDSGLIQDSDGFYYGTTLFGGNNGDGTVYKFAVGGGFFVLHGFGAAGDGEFPTGGLVLGPDGAYYGVCEEGGSHNYGTVYRIVPNVGYSQIYSFTSMADGRAPQGLASAGGYLYGTTTYGGPANAGTIFKITTGGVLTTVHYFAATEGYYPGGILTLENDGKIYGTTQYGASASGGGTVFAYTPEGSLSVVYSFQNSEDSVEPGGRIVRDSSGNLYGTTYYGGANKEGSIYRITSGSVLSTLYSFSGPLDGKSPDSGLTLGNDGYLYGSSMFGGLDAAVGSGTIFKISSSGSFVLLHSFASSNEGSGPVGPLCLGSDGYFLGGCSDGEYSNATIFRFNPEFPEITSFSPVSGHPGSTVSLAGSGFTGATGVSIDGFPASFKLLNDNSLSLTVPLAAKSGVVHVKTSVGIGDSTTNFTVLGGPVINGFTPTAGDVGTQVTVAGSGLTGATAVSIDGYPASFTNVDDSSVAFIVPKGASAGVIHVKTAYGSAASETNFTVTGNPVIASFTPSSGPVGQLVTVMGTGFTDTSSASVDLCPAVFSIVSDSTLKLTVPANASSGAIHVNHSFITASSATNYTVTQPFSITGFTPTSGPVGTIVTLSGYGFADVNAASLDGYISGFTIVSNTSIKVTVPANGVTDPFHLKANGVTIDTPASFTVTP
jgi:uncharacterized repeat protein (TIGR03803 family)